MAIKDKTRKTLWGRSGNRCSICRVELVAEQNEHNRNLNIGDECHINSEQPNGPRYISDYKQDFDDYNNLILLCKNHHKTIDELWETYTSDLLKSLKKNHENWIKTVIDNAKSDNNKTNGVKLLSRLSKGKQIVDTILEAHAFQFDHCEFDSKEESDFISDFLQNLQDWGDLSGFSNFEISKQIQLGYELNKEIEELEKRGFFLFGYRGKFNITNSKKDDLGIWDIATLVIVRQNNPAIINGEKIIAYINQTK